MNLPPTARRTLELRAKAVDSELGSLRHAVAIQDRNLVEDRARLVALEEERLELTAILTTGPEA